MLQQSRGISICAGRMESAPVTTDPPAALLRLPLFACCRRLHRSVRLPAFSLPPFIWITPFCHFSSAVFLALEFMDAAATTRRRRLRHFDYFRRIATFATSPPPLIFFFAFSPSLAASSRHARRMPFISPLFTPPAFHCRHAFRYAFRCSLLPMPFDAIDY